MPTRDAPPGAPFVLAMSTRCGFIETLPSIRNRRSEQSSFRSRNAQVRLAAHPLREASQSLWTGTDRRYVRIVPQWRERAMDVRGPTRAAAKRLTTGVMAACAVAAVSAPVAVAGTLSSANADGVATYSNDSDTGHNFVLSADPVDGHLLFTDTVSTIDPLVSSDALGETCFAEPGTHSATCPPATPVSMTLSSGDDALDLGAGFDNATVDASTGADTIDLHSRGGAETVKLANTPAGGVPSGLSFAGFETVIGGSGGDTFTLPDGLRPVDITGGAGTDKLDFSQRGDGVSV